MDNMETQALVPNLGLGDTDMNLVSMLGFSLNYLLMNVVGPRPLEGHVFFGFFDIFAFPCKRS